MGLLDYYKQFEDVPEEELNKERRARRAWSRTPLAATPVRRP